MKITDTIKYVGVNDHQVDLFEEMCIRDRSFGTRPLRITSSINIGIIGQPFGL